MAGLPMSHSLTGVGSPKASLQNMRNIVGPYATSIRLHQNLENSLHRQNLHWAVNSYFRNEFFIHREKIGLISTEPILDYSPKPLCGFASHHEITRSSGQSTPGFSVLPDETLCRVLSWLDALSCIGCVFLCKKIHNLLTISAYGELTWIAMLENSRYIIRRNVVAHFATVPTILVFVGGHKVDSSKITASSDQSKFLCVLKNADQFLGLEGSLGFDVFKTCYVAEKDRSCLSCSSRGSIVPVVYGYPSDELISALRKGLLRMGGDNLFDGAANWTCTTCDMQFFTYPYSCTTLTCTSTTERDAHESSTAPDRKLKGGLFKFAN